MTYILHLFVNAFGVSDYGTTPKWKKNGIGIGQTSDSKCLNLANISF